MEDPVIGLLLGGGLVWFVLMGVVGFWIGERFVNWDQDRNGHEWLMGECMNCLCSQYGRRANDPCPMRPGRLLQG